MNKIKTNMSQIKKWRIENRYSIPQMASKLEINKYTYRNYEKGNCNMPPEILIKFLRIRSELDDLKLAEMLEEYYE